MKNSIYLENFFRSKGPQLKPYTVKPLFNEPLFNENLDITNGILCPSNSKIYEKEP